MQGRFAFHIIGAGRGGTSLISGLIDAHPECAVHFEEFSTHFLMGHGDDQAMPPPEARRARIDKFIAACETEAARWPDRMWGHKSTTEQIAPLDDAIDAFVTRVSPIPTIFIIRDGRTCVESKVRRTGQPLETAIARWRFSIDLLQRLRREGGPLHEVRYEALVSDPRRELAAVCAFLDVGYTDAMLAGTQSNKMRPEYRRDGFDRPRANQPDPSWVGEIAAELHLLGYELRPRDLD